jgi:hypothetical protein
MMRHSTHIKHVASSSLVVQESKSDNSKVLEPSKIPSRAPRSRSFLNDPTYFQIQSISVSFIVNYVISINLITLVHTDALMPTVTTPSEIIPFYHLNHSIWSLSDSKESSRWVFASHSPVNHLKHKQKIKIYTLKLKESPEYLTN